MSRKLLTLYILFTVTTIFSEEKVQLFSLEESISRALENSPSISASKSKIRAAEAKVLESGFAFSPQLKFTGKIAEMSSVPEFKIPPPFNMTIYPSITEQYGIRLSLQQPLFTGFKLWKSRKIATHSLDASKKEFNKEEIDLIFNVTLAYWNLYRIIKSEEILKKSLSNMEKYLTDVQNFQAQGMATEADVMKVRTKLTDVRLKHIESINGIKLAKANLCTFIKIPSEIEIELTDEPESLIIKEESLIKKTLPELIDFAFINRPEITALSIQSNIYKEQIDIIKGGWYPQLYLMANYDYARPNQRIFPLKDEWKDSWEIGCILQWNIWDGLSTHYQTLQAKESLRQAESNLQKVKDFIAFEVTQLYYTLLSEREKFEAVKEDIASIRENYRVTSNKFENGILSAGDLTDAELSLLMTEQNLLNAKIDYLLAIVKLKKSIGRK